MEKEMQILLKGRAPRDCQAERGQLLSQPHFQIGTTAKKGKMFHDFQGGSVIVMKKIT